MDIFGLFKTNNVPYSYRNSIAIEDCNGNNIVIVHLAIAKVLQLSFWPAIVNPKNYFAVYLLNHNYVLTGFTYSLY